MKALLLAAGLGTRLLPHTRIIPKPLFTIGGKPLIDIHIEALQNAGCEAIVVNTHHLSAQIERHIKTRQFRIPVHICHEPEILGTGGAIKNVESFWDTSPFFVINSDIFSNIDLRSLYRFHLNHPHPVTLVLYNWPDVNTVCVDPDDMVTGFNPEPSSGCQKYRTFTGIQVLDPDILNHIPAGLFSSSIDAFRKMIKEGRKIKAYHADGFYWNDIGTPERYLDTVYRQLSPKAFKAAFAEPDEGKIHRINLAGDGSDRHWCRLVLDHLSMIMVSHGIQTAPNTTEFDAYVAIGRHLHAQGIPVPRIFLEDRFSGLVFLEDLGDTHLQSLVHRAGDMETILARYRAIIDLLITMSIKGAQGFNPTWAYQTAEYDKDLILEKECRYFVEAFLNGFCNLNYCFADFSDEFVIISEKALQSAVFGFMHRDFQSRNIMFKQDKPYIIDFQGGRWGPIQYDLASLLIDPYADLSVTVREKLVEYCAVKMSEIKKIDRNSFFSGYRYCAITRNLQILGAFGYLSRIKNKLSFESYIPAAVRALKRAIDPDEFPKLASLSEQLNKEF